MTAHYRWTLYDRLILSSEEMEEPELSKAMHEWTTRIATGSLPAPVISTTYLGTWNDGPEILSRMSVNWDDVDL